MNASNLIQYVNRDFGRQNEDTRVLQAINDMIFYIAAKMPHGNYKYQSYVNTIVGLEDYPMPSNILHFMHPMRLLEGTGTSDSGYTLEHISKAEYDIREPNPNRTDPTTSKPNAYTIYSRSILLTPIPDKATYLIEINWAKKPVNLVADTDIPTLGDEWDEVIKWGALFRCFAGIGLYDEGTYFRRQYEDDMARPIGLMKDLLDREREYEGSSITQVKNNPL